MNMQAAVIVADGERNRLEIRAVERPAAGPGQLLVRVRAIGINRADLMLRAGHFRNLGGAPAAPIAGLEFAGEVVDQGDAASGWAAGARVMAMGASAYAEYATVDARLAMRVPDGVSWEQAASLPVALMTAHDAVVTNGRLARGETILIQGASTGVGIAAIQIARVMGASKVFGTSTSAAKLARLAALGLDVGIDTGAEDFSTRIRADTGERGVDLIVDHVGASALPGNLAAAAIRGRVVNVGRMGGKMGEIDLDLLSLKRIALIGVTFRTRTPEEVQALIAVMQRDLWPHVAAGRIALPVDRVYRLEEAAAAHERMRANAHLGKIVLIT
jgi:NADPH2:quinone reductase